MERNALRFTMAAMIGLVMLAMIGCEKDENERVVEIARESSQRQAEQNQQMGKLSQEVAESTKRLVEEDAKARTQITLIHQQLQTERTEIGKQRDSLEGDRKEIAQQRHRDPLIAAAITDVGVLLACLAPLLLAFYLLRAAKNGNEQEELSELLITELYSDTPLLLPPERDSSTRGRLPGAAVDAGNRLDDGRDNQTLA